MSKRYSELKNLKGAAFKTVDVQAFSTRRLSDSYSNRVSSSRVLNSFEYVQKTDQPLVSSIRHRKKQEEETINSATISNVVKNYVLPMFTYDLQKHQRNKRHRDYGLRKSSLDSAEGPVYSELKLSEKLQIESLELSKKVCDLESEMKALLVEKTLIEKELAAERQQLLNCQTLIVHMNSINAKNEIISPQNNMHSTYTNNNYLTYKNLYEESEKTIKKLSKCLQEERALNDIRLIIKYYLNYIKQAKEYINEVRALL